MASGRKRRPKSAARKPKRPRAKKSDESIAAELGRPESTVRRWRRRGMPDKEPARSKWIENHTRKAKENGDSKLSDEKLRAEIDVLRIKRARQKLALDHARRRLVDRSVVMRRCEGFLNDARVRIESWPAIAAAYVEESQRVAVLDDLKKEARALLLGLARMAAGDDE